MVHSHVNWPRAELTLEIQEKDMLKAPFSSLVGKTHVETRLSASKSCYSAIDFIMLGKTASTAGIEV